MKPETEAALVRANGYLNKLKIDLEMVRREIRYLPGDSQVLTAVQRLAEAAQNEINGALYPNGPSKPSDFGVFYERRYIDPDVAALERAVQGACAPRRRRAIHSN